MPDWILAVFILGGMFTAIKLFVKFIMWWDNE